MRLGEPSQLRRGRGPLASKSEMPSLAATWTAREMCSPWIIRSTVAAAACTSAAGLGDTVVFVMRVPRDHEHSRKWGDPP
jgi:hypothetical protein